MAVYYASLMVAILIRIAGQIALKSGANGSATVFAQFLNPLTMIGLALYVLAAICYVVALKKIPVSIAFPSVAASYAVRRASVMERAPRLAANGRNRADRQRRAAHSSALKGPTSVLTAKKVRISATTRSAASAESCG